MDDKIFVEAMTRAWQRIVAFPRAECCRHWAALAIIEELEKLGHCPPVEIIKAVVEANDEVSLAWKP